MTPLDLARAFIEKGKEDELLLSKLVSEAEVSDDIYGFHAQQAAEKFIKAVLAVEEMRPTRTHDLAALFEEVESLGHDVPPEILEARSFTPFAVRNRYPFLAPAPTLDREATPWARSEDSHVGRGNRRYLRLDAWPPGDGDPVVLG
jgi:HEPN domain-containing protein